MTESILETIKKMLGAEYDNSDFNVDIIVWINSAFMVLNQLGVGPKDGFVITGPAEVWSDYITDQNVLSTVKTYVFLKTKLGFDSSTASSAVLDSMKQMIQDYEWRLNVAVD